MATAIAPIVKQPQADVVRSPDAGLTLQVVPMERQEPAADLEIQVQLQPVPRPERISLGTLSDQGFRVIKPIAVQIETRGDSVVASWPEVEEFGTGASTSYALEDLGRTVAELYRTLQLDETRLGPDLESVWGKLKEYVVPRR